MSAQALLAQREHGRQELIIKLTTKGASFLEASQVVSSLAEQGLQSDHRYASCCIQSKANRGYGPNHIRQYLNAKGVDSALVDSVMETIDIDWPAKARVVWEKKFGALAQDAKSKLKQKQFLFYRGFNSTDIERLFSELASK